MVTLRTAPSVRDVPEIEEILRSTGAFRPREMDVAIELVEDRITKGANSEYSFILADSDGRAEGYVCYGPITMTEGSFDIYWIAVRKASQGMGIGGRLLEAAESEIRRLGGRRIFVDTSSRADYSDTRAFYRKKGYAEAAVVPGYYAEGDDKVVLMKSLR